MNAPKRRCARSGSHHRHDWVPSPGSAELFDCSGKGGPRRLDELVAEQPVLAEIGITAVALIVAVMAA